MLTVRTMLMQGIRTNNVKTRNKNGVSTYVSGVSIYVSGVSIYVRGVSIYVSIVITYVSGVSSCEWLKVINVNFLFHKHFLCENILRTDK